MRLSYSQALILAGAGLQHKCLDDILKEINMEASQALALFNKSVKRIARTLKEIYMNDAEQKFDMGNFANKRQEELKKMNPGKTEVEDEYKERKQFEKEIYGVEDELLAKRQKKMGLEEVAQSKGKNGNGVDNKNKNKKVKGNPLNRMDVELTDEQLKSLNINKKGAFVAKKHI